MEEMDQLLEAGSVDEMISNKLRFVDVNWDQASRAAARVMRPGGKVSMNVWCDASQRAALKAAFERAGFKNVTLLGDGAFASTLDLTEAVCSRPLLFKDCHFQGGVRFSTGHFAGQIQFNGGQITGGLDFDVPTFSPPAGVELRAITIRGPVSFKAESLHLTAEGLEVHGLFSIRARSIPGLYLGKTRLLGGFTLQGELQPSRALSGVTLRGLFDWRESTIIGDLHLDHPQLEPGASVDLSGSTLHHGLIFSQHGALPESIRLDGTSIQGHVSLEAPLGSRLRVIAKDQPPRFAGGATLKNVDLGECLLLGNTFPKVEIANIAWARRFGRSVLYDEVKLRASRDFSSVASLREASQWLKQEYQRLGDHVRSGDFHHAEMEAKRREYGFPRRWISWECVYWILSGYGIGHMRALVILVGLIVGFSGLYYWTRQPTFNGFSEALRYSIGVAAFQRPEMPNNFTELQKWLHIVEAVLEAPYRSRSLSLRCGCASDDETGLLSDQREGTAWERTPWHATQRAAWEALKNAESGSWS